MGNHQEDLKKIFLDTFNKEMQTMIALEESGSNRKYYRMQHGNFSAIGVYNEDKKENEAFLAFSRHFLRKGICVPTVYNEDLDRNIYLISDLGDQTLYRFLCQARTDNENFSQQLLNRYKQALDGLLDMQFSVCCDFDFSVCYPRMAFDKQSILWDLNYFKYYFLKLAHIPFDEQLLENDFHTLADFLLEADASFFLYRDFQSRNMMICNDALFFIDYQGGRKGALQYDVASLLYDGKANIPQETRQVLLSYYVEQLYRKHPKAALDFEKYYYAFVFIRIMQAMGSYGFRGFYEKKQHFLQSIPFALKNLEWLLNNVQLPVEIPVLWNLYRQLIESESLRQYGRPTLKISINSFSYKRGLPADKSEHGGGFVFDCRCLPNPGREDRYKTLNGKDKDVIDYLDDKPEINIFFARATSIIDMAVQNYIQRQFQHLMISFGCTGGQHRSVYFAERLRKYLNDRYSVNIDTEINHYNLEINNQQK